MSRVDFRPHDIRHEELTTEANVYIMVGNLQQLADDGLKAIFLKIQSAMSDHTSILAILVDSPLLEDEEVQPLTVQRENQCRDVIMRKMGKSGARTMTEGQDLLSYGSLYVSSWNRKPGSVVTVMYLEVG